MEIFLAALGWMTVGTMLLGIVYRRAFLMLWREPVLRRPVLIIESDDWGAGPPAQAAQLERIAAILASHRDCRGHNPVMTLGTVLGVADGARILADGLRNYYARRLDEPPFAATLEVIKRGVDGGVFALQLHGEEHYWPPALLAGARTLPQVTAWLGGSDAPTTETLPAPLQSRWIDATLLPTKALGADEIRTAAQAEVASFRRIFGTAPRVAVPPTFIWNDAVETAWAESGVQFVVTPGRRFEARDAQGEPIAMGSAIVNGEMGAAGIRYVVRDDYFEPARGHKAEQGLAALLRKTRAGRPTLLETHRANFLGDAAIAEAAVKELDRLLGLALRTFPGVLFLSTEDLAVRMQQHDAKLVERRIAIRLHIWLLRLWEVSRLRKLACLTGTIVPAGLLYLLTWRSAAVIETH
jgi:hypothetical protein